MNYLADARFARSRSQKTMSSLSDLQWLLVRKHNSFVVKRLPEGPVLSKEPGNLLNVHSQKFSGLVNGEVTIPGNLLRREVFDPVVQQVRAPPLRVPRPRADTPLPPPATPLAPTQLYRRHPAMACPPGCARK